MNINSSTKQLIIQPPGNLYKWARLWASKQKKFFLEEVELRRERQIVDFIFLNGFQQVKFKIDTDVFNSVPVDMRVQRSSEADLVVITDQKFSRFPCQKMIKQIQTQLNRCPKLYLCLNRNYINIDDTYQDLDLDHNFNRAITQWLVNNLPQHEVTDLSLDYRDRGDWFSWAIPDRHYYIRCRN